MDSASTKKNHCTKSFFKEYKYIELLFLIITSIINRVLFHETLHIHNVHMVSVEGTAIIPALLILKNS